MNYSPKGETFVSKREQYVLLQANISTGTYVLLETQSIHYSFLSNALSVLFNILLEYPSTFHIISLPASNFIHLYST